MATTILPHRACRSKYKPQKIPNSDSMSTQKVVPPLGVKYKANKLPKAIPEAKEEKVYQVLMKIKIYNFCYYNHIIMPLQPYTLQVVMILHIRSNIKYISYFLLEWKYKQK
eukprot:34103_1